MAMHDFSPENSLRLAKKAVFFKLRGSSFESDFLDTEDLIQETLLVYCKYIHSAEAITDHADLMFDIADKVVKSGLRSKKRDRERKRSLAKVFKERVPLIPAAFPADSLDEIRSRLHPADAKVIDFVFEHPEADAEEVARRLGITSDAYRASFYRIRSASWQIRQTCAQNYIRTRPDFTTDALNTVFRFSQSTDERLEFSIAIGIQYYRPLALDRVQFGNQHFDDEVECAAVRKINYLIESVKRKDPALRLAILDWRLFHLASCFGAPSPDDASEWIHLASVLAAKDPSIPERFEDYLWQWFDTHSGADRSLFDGILRSFDAVSLPVDHVFRIALAAEQNLPPRPFWMLSGNAANPFP